VTDLAFHFSEKIDECIMISSNSLGEISQIVLLCQLPYLIEWMTGVLRLKHQLLTLLSGCQCWGESHTIHRLGKCVL